MDWLDFYLVSTALTLAGLSIIYFLGPNACHTSSLVGFKFVIWAIFFFVIFLFKTIAYFAFVASIEFYNAIIGLF